MGERIKVAYSIDEETSRKIKEIAAATHRADSHVIDWLVAEAYQRMAEVHRSEMTLEQAAQAPTE